MGDDEGSHHQGRHNRPRHRGHSQCGKFKLDGRRRSRWGDSSTGRAEDTGRMQSTAARALAKRITKRKGGHHGRRTAQGTLCHPYSRSRLAGRQPGRVQRAGQLLHQFLGSCDGEEIEEHRLSVNQHGGLWLPHRTSEPNRARGGQDLRRKRRLASGGRVRFVQRSGSWGVRTNDGGAE